MQILFQILIAVFIVSAISLIGNFLLVTKFLKKSLFYMVAFSAGALLGAAFLDLLPEALESNLRQRVPIFIIIGILIFFIIEKFLHWHHHHTEGKDIHTFTYLNIIGDGVHNFTDGVIIAIAFISSPAIGIATTIAIVAHEIPHEVGNFAILLYGGFSRMKATIYNFLSALTAFLGAMAAYFFSNKIENINFYIGALAIGGLVYIATTDLIPEIHKETEVKKTFMQFILMVFGIFLIWAAKRIFEG